MELEIGIVCGSCDQYSSLGTTRCPSCGDDLAVLARKPGSKSVASTPAVQQPPASDVVSKAPAARVASPAAPPVAPPAAASPVAAPPRTAASTGNISTPGALFTEPLRRRVSPMPGPGGLRAQSAQSAQFGTVPQPPGPRASNLSSTLSEEELMDQAKNYVCRSCSTPVPLGHKFCGRCGAAIPPEIVNARTQFFGQLQMPGKAKLDPHPGRGHRGPELPAQRRAAHRRPQRASSCSPTIPSSRPATPTSSTATASSSSATRARSTACSSACAGTVEIAAGDHFSRASSSSASSRPARANDGPAPDGTYFYSSPKHQSPFRSRRSFRAARPA